MLIINDRIKSANAKIDRPACSDCPCKNTLATSVPNKPPKKGNKLALLLGVSLLYLSALIFDNTTSKKTKTQISKSNNKTMNKNIFSPIISVISLYEAKFKINEVYNQNIPSHRKRAFFNRENFIIITRKLTLIAKLSVPKNTAHEMLKLPIKHNGTLKIQIIIRRFMH